MGQYKYVFDAVVEHFDELDNTGIVAVDDNAKFKRVIDSYKVDHQYTQDGYQHLLQGLLFNVAFKNLEIEKLLWSWGVKPTDKKIINYWQVLAFRVLKLYNAIDNDARVEKLLTK